MSDLNLGIILPSAVGLLGGAGRTQRSARRIGPIVASVTIEEQHTDEMEVTDHPMESGSAVTDHVFKRPAEFTIRAAWSNSPGATSGLLKGASGLLRSVVEGQVGNVIRGATNGVINGSGLPAPLATVLSSGVISAGVSAFNRALNTGTGKGTSKAQDVYQSLLQLQASAIPFDVLTGKRMYKNVIIRTLSVITDKESENVLIATIGCRQLQIVQTQVVSVSATPEQQRNPESTAPAADLGTKQPERVTPSPGSRLRSKLQELWGG